MARPHALLAAAATLVLGSAIAAPPEVPVLDGTPTELVASLTWLAGHWRGESWHAFYTSPEGGMVLSLAKDYRKDGRVGFFEYERIFADEQAVVLVPSPFGKESVRFRLTALDPTARRARFENPEHDFPRVITYQRVSEEELVFTLDGEQDGEPIHSVSRLTRQEGP